MKVWPWSCMICRSGIGSFMGKAKRGRTLRTADGVVVCPLLKLILPSSEIASSARARHREGGHLAHSGSPAVRRASLRGSRIHGCRRESLVTPSLTYSITSSARGDPIHSGNPAFRRPSAISFAFDCPPRAIQEVIVKEGSVSST